MELGDFPINISVHPRGRYAAVLHSGYSQHQILCVDLATTNVVSRTPVAETFYGLEFSADGKRLFCSGAGEEVIHGFDFDAGRLSNERSIRLRDQEAKGVPGGLALDTAGRTLWVANVWGTNVSRVDFRAAPPKVTEIPIGGGGASSPAVPVTPSPDFDTAAAEKRAEAALYSSNGREPFPHA